MDIDDFDLKLLQATQHNARISQSDLGEIANLSTAAVNRRLKRLVDTGIIRKYTALLNQEALGLGLTVIANVEVESEKSVALDLTRQSFIDCSHIQQVYYVTGEWDFVLVFILKSMEQYNELTKELFFSNDNVKRFKTLVSMSNDKVGSDLPVPG